MSITYEERVQSKWTWDRLRGSDRRLLLRYAIKNGAKRITMLDNHDQLNWDSLLPVVQTSLLGFNWNDAFRRA